MKVSYTCEYCGKKFSSEKEALACEAKHIAAEKQQKELEKQKDKRLEEIRNDYKALFEKIQKFNEDYSEPATISYTGALDKILDHYFRLFN